MNEPVILRSVTYSIDRKVEFLRHPEVYPDATKVEALETHMSWIFLVNQYVYKLKKPMCYDFLDFRTSEARYKYCLEEVRINQRLASNIYLGVIPLTIRHGVFQLDGAGEVIDWLIKMRRLPREYMLDTALKENTIRNDQVQQAAEMLVDFYLTSLPVKIERRKHREQIVNDIELNSEELLRNEFKLSQSLIISITTDLLHFIVKHADLFDIRIADGRIIECHGDLRPEHICLAPKPVIIDRLEFNKDLRIMDVAEELSFLALECDMLASPTTGQLFINVYKWKSLDKIPDMLIVFYKAKRAFLRARLTIQHLLEKKYQSFEQRWRNRCEAYLQAADANCKQLAGDIATTSETDKKISRDDSE